MRPHGVVDLFPLPQLAVEFLHLQRAGRDLIELLGVIALGALDRAVELGRAWRMHEQVQVSRRLLILGRGWSNKTAKGRNLPLRLSRRFAERCQGVNSRFTTSLTCFPSTLIPVAAKRAMTFFITVPMSFIVGEPISAMTALTPATTSSSPAALGR
jgi:hypothetical protein